MDLSELKVLVEALQARVMALEVVNKVLAQHAKNVRFNGSSIALPEALEQLTND